MKNMTSNILMTALAVTVMTSATTTTAKAPDTHAAMKMATIEKMYQHDVKSQGQEYPVVLQQYGSKSLQAAMQLEQDYFDKEQLSCHIGHDVLWDSQDPDYHQNKQFSINMKGLVTVSLAQGSTVNYELTCDNKECHVNDVIVDDNGTSLKQYLQEACQ